MAQKSKFTDRQKKNIVKAYVECQNFSAVARKYHCSETTIRRIVGKNPDVAEMVEEEKRENSKKVREHMKEQAKDICEALDLFVAALKSEKKLESASIRDIAISLGILIDKYTDKEEISASGGIIILPEVKGGAEDES